MKLRRRTLNEIKGQPKLQKALAIALLVKSRLDRKQTIRDYNITKISDIAKVSPTTIKKYMPILKRMGLVALFGRNKQHITFRAVHSKTNNRNVDITQFKLDNFLNVLRSIQAYLAIAIQARKEYVKRTIQIANNPNNLKDYKDARQEVKRLVRRGYLHDVKQQYEEYGISYKRFAKEIGICERTAFDVIVFAISNGWLVKHKNVIQVYAPKVNYRKIKGFTFSTEDNLYIVKANTYTITLTALQDKPLGNIRL